MREDSDSGVTAILSILKEPKDREGKPWGAPYRVGYSHGEQHHFTILLWFIGQKVLMPPYLPRISARAEAAGQKDIIRRLRELSAQYWDDYSDHELNTREALEILEGMRNVGRSIAQYPASLDNCLKLLAESDLNIKNLIIHTDEHAIPWHLAYSEYRPDFDYLCNRYPCGTILVEDRDEALPRFIKYSKRSQQPEVKNASKKEICLIAGELGQTTPQGKDLGLAYVEKLKIYLDRFQIMNVRCVPPEEWKECEGRPKRIARHLDEILDQSQIVHFTCHVVDEKLKITEHVMIGPDVLAGLSELNSKPLVVLHGCSSAGLARAGSEGAELCRAFLEKGAGGCVATVFPVNIPTMFSDGAETLIDYFYQNVFSLNTYGVALHRARQTFRRASPSKEDPQGLFYHLFGDPRETLFTSRAVTPADRLAQFDHAEAAPEPLILRTLRISCVGVSDQELQGVLLEIDGVLEANLQRRAVAMGAEIASEIPGMIATVVLLTPAVIVQIRQHLKKRFAQPINIEVIDPQRSHR